MVVGKARVRFAPAVSAEPGSDGINDNFLFRKGLGMSIAQGHLRSSSFFRAIQKGNTPMQLINSKELLERIFTEDSRPSLKTWQRRVRDGSVPHTKIGGRLYYDEAKVREAIMASPGKTNRPKIK